MRPPMSRILISGSLGKPQAGPIHEAICFAWRGT